MALQLERHRFTLEEFERLVESGGFDKSARVELIWGEIVDMAPIGIRHEACVTRLTTLLVQKLGSRAVVWAQNSIRLRGNSRPQPDVAVLRPRADFYAGKPPTPRDVLLVSEVSDTSLAYDRSTKGSLYAGAGIPEYWIVNLQDNVIEVLSKPTEGTYRQAIKAQPGESIALPPSLGGTIVVSEILGKQLP